MVRIDGSVIRPALLVAVMMTIFVRTTMLSFQVRFMTTILAITLAVRVSMSVTSPMLAVAVATIATVMRIRLTMELLELWRR
jgi:hypothetical protein